MRRSPSPKQTAGIKKQSDKVRRSRSPEQTADIHKQSDEALDTVFFAKEHGVMIPMDGKQFENTKGLNPTQQPGFFERIAHGRNLHNPLEQILNVLCHPGRTNI